MWATLFSGHAGKFSELHSRVVSGRTIKGRDEGVGQWRGGVVPAERKMGGGAVCRMRPAGSQSAASDERLKIHCETHDPGRACVAVDSSECRGKPGGYGLGG